MVILLLCLDSHQRLGPTAVEADAADGGTTAVVGYYPWVVAPLDGTFVLKNNMAISLSFQIH